jgi:hypothetical protein
MSWGKGNLEYGQLALIMIGIDRSFAATERSLFEGLTTNKLTIGSNDTEMTLSTRKV